MCHVPQVVLSRAECDSLFVLFVVVFSQVFETTGKNNMSVVVAGLVVSSGKLSRTHLFRVLRNEEVLADRLKASSMRHHKDRVNEITKDKVS